MSQPSNTRPFRPAVELISTKKPSASFVASSLPGAVSEVSEARYWSESFALPSPPQGSTSQYAHPRRAKIVASTAAIIHELQFGPPLDENIESKKNEVSPLAVASGPRVQLYGVSTQSELHRMLVDHKATHEHVDVNADRQVPTLGQLATAAQFRTDGRLMVVGTDQGQVRISDTASRATLCTFQCASRLPVRSVRWLRDGQHVLSAGDDARLRIWKLSDSLSSGIVKPTLELMGHGDVVRCAALWQPPLRFHDKWPHAALAFTGSYDCTIRIWNVDELDGHGTDGDGANRCLAVLTHGSPVETLLTLPSADPAVPMWLLSAGGTTVKVWNPITGACVHTSEARHRKTITALLSVTRHDGETNAKRIRVITAGLDGLLRVHAWDNRRGTLEHLHGMKVAESVSALAVNESGTRLAIGTVNGLVLVRQKGLNVVHAKRTREARAGTYAFFTRGMNADASAADFIAEIASKKKKLRKFDVALKQFRYGDALDEALETRIPQVVVAVLEELGKRRGLAIALSNRDEETLEPILSFVVRYIGRPRFTALLIGVSYVLLDVYGSVAGQSEVIDELFEKLRTQIRTEIRAQKQLLFLAGQIDYLSASSQMDNS